AHRRLPLRRQAPRPQPGDERDRSRGDGHSTGPGGVRTLRTNLFDRIDAAQSLPLPLGEVGSRNAIRVRGYNLSIGPIPPHSNPLPAGEREQAELAPTIST